MKAKTCIAGRAALGIIIAMVAIALVACAPDASILPEEGKMALSLSSPAFQSGEVIPVKYTCNGQDISPSLVWSEPPPETQSFALIMDDPDAPGGVFTHWVLFNLPPDRRELPEAITTEKQLANGGLQGKNDFGKIGYGGPCPPPGHPHRYSFTLYALDKPLDLPAGASRRQVTDAMGGHILAQGQLMGTYQR